MAGAVSLGTLVVRILADTTAIEKGVNHVLKRISLAAGASLSVAIAGAIGDGIKNAVNLNASLARIHTITNEAFSTDQIRAFSNSLGVDAVKASEALYTALSSGAKNLTEAQDDVAAAAKLARATNSDLNATLAAVVAGFNAYSASGLTAAQAADVLFTIQKDGVGTMDALVAAVGQVIPSAANLGISFQQLGADLAASTLTGKSYAAAATGLKVVLQELGRSTSDVAKTFKEASGKSIEDFLAQGGKLNDVIKTIIQTVGKGGLDELFHAKGSAAAIKQLLVSVEGVDQATKDMANSAGAVDTAFGQVDKSLSGQLNDLKVRLTNAFGTLGDKVLPDLIAKANSLFDALKQAGANIKPTLDAVAQDFGLIGAQLGPLVPSFGTLLNIFSKLAPVIAAAATAMLAYRTYTLLAAAATALWGLAESIAAFIALAAGIRSAAEAMALLDTAFAANPIGIVIAAVAALAAAFVYGWQTSETFRDVVTKTWNDIVAVVGLAVKAFVTLMIDWAAAPLYAFKAILEGLGHLPSWLGGGVADNAAGAVGALINNINAWRDSALSAIDDVIQAAKLVPTVFTGWEQDAGSITAELAKQGITQASMDALTAPKIHIPKLSNTFGGGGGVGGGGLGGSLSDAASKAKAAAAKMADAIKSIKDSLGPLAHASEMTRDQIDSLFKTLAKDTKDALKGKAEAAALKLEKTWNSSLDKMADKLAAFKDRVSTELQFGQQIKQAIRDLGNVAQESQGIGVTFLGIQNQLRAAIAQSNAFASALKTLKNLGLNATSLSQLAQAGPAALEQANAIVMSGAAGITGAGGINDLQKQLDANANTIINTTADSYYKAGQSVATGFLDGLKSQQKAMEDAMDAMGQRAAAAIKKALGIHSPSKVMHGIGGYVAEGLADGMLAGQKKVQNSSMALANSTVFGPGSITVSGGVQNPEKTGIMLGHGILSVLEKRQSKAILNGTG